VNPKRAIIAYMNTSLPNRPQWLSLSALTHRMKRGMNKIRVAVIINVSLYGVMLHLCVCVRVCVCVCEDSSALESSSSSAVIVSVEFSGGCECVRMCVSECVCVVTWRGRKQLDIKR